MQERQKNHTYHLDIRFENGFTQMSVLADAFIKQNLSPGGCADLLAVTYFLYSLE